MSPKFLTYLQSHFTPLRISNSRPCMPLITMFFFFLLPNPCASTTSSKIFEWTLYLMSISLQYQNQCLAQDRHPHKRWLTRMGNPLRPQILLGKGVRGVTFFIHKEDITKKSVIQYVFTEHLLHAPTYPVIACWVVNHCSLIQWKYLKL